MSSTDDAAHEIRTSLFRLGRRLRQELPEGELAGAVAVPPRTLDRDGLLGHLLQREVGEGAQLALHQQGAATAPERSDAHQDRCDAGAGGAVEHDVDAVRRDRAVVTSGWEAKLGWWAHRLLPVAAHQRVARQGL